MLKRIGLPLILISLAGTSQAETNWTAIGNTNEHVYALDVNSISQVTQYPYTKYKKAWLKRIIFNDLSKDGMTVNDYTMILYWADCGAQTLGIKSNTNYKSNGKVFDTSYNPSYVTMNDVVPESIGAGILEAICN